MRARGGKARRGDRYSVRNCEEIPVAGMVRRDRSARDWVAGWGRWAGGARRSVKGGSVRRRGGVGGGAASRRS